MVGHHHMLVSQATTWDLCCLQGVTCHQMLIMTHTQRPSVHSVSWQARPQTAPASRRIAAGGPNLASFQHSLRPIALQRQRVMHVHTVRHLSTAAICLFCQTRSRSVLYSRIANQNVFSMARNASHRRPALYITLEKSCRSPACTPLFM